MVSLQGLIAHKNGETIQEFISSKLGKEVHYDIHYLSLKWLVDSDYSNQLWNISINFKGENLYGI